MPSSRKRDYELLQDLSGAGGVTDHGALTGLGDDDHTQYILKTVLSAANSIIKADSANTPIILPVGASTLVGRAAAGGVAALTVAQVKTLLAYVHSEMGSLQGGQAGQYYHLTAAEYTALQNGIASGFTPGAHKDSHDPNDGGDPLDCAAAGEIVGVVAAAEGTAHSFSRSDHIHQVQHGIADNHIVTVDGTVADNMIAKWTANGLEGRTYAQLLTDLSGQAGAAFLWNNQLLDNCKSVQFNSEYDNGSKTGNFTLTLDNGQKQKVTLTANTMTITIAHPTSIADFRLKVVNGGLATITWAASSGSVYPAGKTWPSLTASGTDFLNIYSDGTDIWIGAVTDYGTP